MLHECYSVTVLQCYSTLYEYSYCTVLLCSVRVAGDYCNPRTRTRTRTRRARTASSPHIINKVAPPAPMAVMLLVQYSDPIRPAKSRLPYSYQEEHEQQGELPYRTSAAAPPAGLPPCHGQLLAATSGFAPAPIYFVEVLQYPYSTCTSYYESRFCSAYISYVTTTTTLLNPERYMVLVRERGPAR